MLVVVELHLQGEIRTALLTKWHSPRLLARLRFPRKYKIASALPNRVTARMLAESVSHAAVDQFASKIEACRCARVEHTQLDFYHEYAQTNYIHLRPEVFGERHL
jgi:hypothetical protein